MKTVSAKDLTRGQRVRVVVKGAEPSVATVAFVYFPRQFGMVDITFDSPDYPGRFERKLRREEQIEVVE